MRFETYVRLALTGANHLSFSKHEQHVSIRVNGADMIASDVLIPVGRGRRTAAFLCLRKVKRSARPGRRGKMTPAVRG